VSAADTCPISFTGLTRGAANTLGLRVVGCVQQGREHSRLRIIGSKLARVCKGDALNFPTFRVTSRNGVLDGIACIRSSVFRRRTESRAGGCFAPPQSAAIQQPAFGRLPGADCGRRLLFRTAKCATETGHRWTRRLNGTGHCRIARRHSLDRTDQRYCHRGAVRHDSGAANHGQPGRCASWRRRSARRRPRRTSRLHSNTRTSSAIRVPIDFQPPAKVIAVRQWVVIVRLNHPLKHL
jgi:hypothetical protein